MSAIVVATPSSSPVRAIDPVAEIVVTGKDDGTGQCELPADSTIFQCTTLRAAVAKANGSPGPTVVSLPAGTYKLLNGPLTLSDDGTELVGVGRPVPPTGANPENAATVIDAGGLSQAIVVNAQNVVISGLAVTGGNAGRRTGGAILVASKGSGFILSDSTIVKNSGSEGGGLDVSKGADTVLIERSTFVGNVADKGKGGGLRVSGSVDIVNSTFADNTAQSGGAVSVAGAATISYSTFVDNNSNNSKGGGVDRNGGTLYITGSILTQALQSGSDGSDCSGTPALVGVNFVGNSQGCNPGADTLTRALNGSIGLDQAGLASNGGATQTIALSGTVGVDVERQTKVDVAGKRYCPVVGSNGFLGGGLVDDQRGLTRPGGEAVPSRCDLGAYEINPLDVELSLSSSTTTPVVGASTIPAENVLRAASETEALFDSSLTASPLRAFPLRAFPLRAFPLRAFPLRAFPLRAFFTSAAPLRAFPLRAFPLRAFPFDSVLLSDMVLLSDGGWQKVLAGTPLADTPLQALTLTDVLQLLEKDDAGTLVPPLSPDQRAAIENLDFADINLEGTPLRAFPITAFLLSTVPLRAFPLRAFDGDATADWCDLFGDFCAQPGVLVDGSLDPSITLASLALAGESLEELDLTQSPLGTFLDTAAGLESFPLRAFPLRAFDLQSTPLRAFPLRAFGDDLGTLVDCATLETTGVACADATLGDVSAAGAWLGDTTLDQLIALITSNPDLLAAFNEYGLADLLVALLPPDSVPWEQLDLGTPGLQNGADPLVDPFQYFVDVTLTAPATTATVEVALPKGFAYVPGGTRLDGLPVPDREGLLSLSSADDDVCGAVDGQIVLTYALSNLPAGTTRLAIDVRAGLTLGPAMATACVEASAGALPVEDSAATTVTVVDPNNGDSTTRTLTVTSGTAGAGVDVNLGYVTGDDSVDYYQFDVSRGDADLGLQGDLFLSNLPADYDLVLYGEKSEPLRNTPADTIGYLDDVFFDLNPFDDRVQADAVQDLPQRLPEALDPSGDYVPVAISANRDTTDEQLQTGTLKAGTYFVQVSAYNGAFSADPYALRFQTTQSLSRPECAPLPYPAEGWGTLPGAASLDPDTNTLFLVNEQLLRYTYGDPAAQSVLDAVDEVAARADLGVIGAVLPVDGDAIVRGGYADRAANPCEPSRSNDIVRAIGDVIDEYVLNPDGSERLPVEHIVIIGDDRQIPMANIVDDANYSNERVFAQGFVGNNESISALVAGTYRSDDPYGTDAGIWVRDHELFVPDRAVGRLLETPEEIIRSLDNFVEFDGRLDPDTERNALQTGYEFLEDGAVLNADNLDADGYSTTRVFGETWTDDALIDALAVPGSIDVIGIHAHFDENNALPAFDNFNPSSPGDLFSSDEFDRSRSIVYSMGCHAGYSLSDIQVGGSAPDWAQRTVGELGNVFAGNTGFGYGDSAKVALAEQLTADFAAEVAQNGSVGQAWVDAKQRTLSNVHVLDAYQEKTLQQFVFYGLPMFHVGVSPPDLSGPQPSTQSADTSPSSGIELRSTPIGADLRVAGVTARPNLVEVSVPDQGSYYTANGQTLDVNARPIQPLFTQDITSPDENFVARDVLITGLRSSDISPGSFDPVFFKAATDFGQPRPEFFDGSFPAELSTVRGYRAEGRDRQQLLLAVGQFRGSADVAEDGAVGTQRLHERVETEVYYGPADATDVTPPSIERSNGFIDDDVVFFEVEASDVDSEVERVYVLFRDALNPEWTGVDLVLGNGVWRGGRPFFTTEAEFAVQAVDSSGNVAMSDSKSLFFLTAQPGEIGDLQLVPDRAPDLNGWYDGQVDVTAAVDGTDVDPLDNSVQLSVDGAPKDYAGPETVAGDGGHVVTAFDALGGGFAVLYFAIDQTAPSGSVPAPDPDQYVQGPVGLTATFDDFAGSGIAKIVAFEGTTKLGERTFVDPPRRGVLTLEPLVRDGVRTITFTAADAAGNTSDPLEVTVSIDGTAPALVGQVSGVPAPGSFVQSATLVARFSDAGSGLASVEAFEGTTKLGGQFDAATGSLTVSVGAPDGVRNIEFVAKDEAGNERRESVTVSIDRTAPTVVVLKTPNTLYANTDVRIDVQPTSVGGSAVVGTWFTTSRTSTPQNSGASIRDEGTTRVTGFARDAAGNIGSSAPPLTVQIDKTAPGVELNLSSPNTVFGGTITATYRCTDLSGVEPSGIASCNITSNATITNPRPSPSDATKTVVDLSAAQAGAYSVTVTALDRAGNTFLKTETFRVGYRVCLDYDGTQPKNVGSNYTIKLRLCDASGKDLSSRNLVLTAVSLTRRSDGTVIAPGANDSGKANGGIYEFRYSSSGYTYNLDTTGVPPGDWTLDFVVGGDSSGLTYSAPFRLI